MAAGEKRMKSSDRAAVLLSLLVTAVLIAGLLSIHPGPVDAVHDTLQMWVKDFLR